MIYNIVVLADIHCGVIGPTYQYDNLELVNIFIKKYSNIDLLVINGDYFDAILSMNSKPAILAIQR
jgi:predicted MPP superfamily phosphohydrolase